MLTNNLSKKTFNKNPPFLYFYTGNEEDGTGKETKEMLERIKTCAKNNPRKPCKRAVFGDQYFKKFQSSLLPQPEQKRSTPKTTGFPQLEQKPGVPSVGAVWG